MILAAIDRIEEDWMVLVPDRGSPFSLPKDCFPGLKEGDRVRIELTRDNTSEEESRLRTAELKKRLYLADLSTEKVDD